jgi:hypothetical protein
MASHPTLLPAQLLDAKLKVTAGVDGKTFDTINPSTEKVICAVAEATEKVYVELCPSPDPGSIATGRRHRRCPCPQNIRNQLEARGAGEAWNISRQSRKLV